MQMMYEIIAKELKHMNLENAHPRDYLNFYCLGNREEPPADEAASADNSVCTFHCAVLLNSFKYLAQV